MEAAAGKSCVGPGEGGCEPGGGPCPAQGFKGHRAVLMATEEGSRLLGNLLDLQRGCLCLRGRLAFQGHQ